MSGRPIAADRSGHLADRLLPPCPVSCPPSSCLASQILYTPWSTLEACTEAIVSERVASEDEVTAALTILQHFTADPQTLICGPRIFPALVETVNASSDSGPGWQRHWQQGAA
jgi:hypothetical protein